MTPYSGPDPQLLAAVQAAERGEILDRIILVCGSTVIVGTPTSSINFAKANHTSYTTAIANEIGGWKTSREDKERMASEQASQILRFFSPVDTSEVIGIMSLSPAHVIPPGLASYDVPAIRVNLNRVDSWWVAPFTENPVEFRGGGGGGSISF